MGFQQILHQMNVNPRFGRHLRGNSGGPGDPGIPFLAGELEDQGRGLRSLDDFFFQAVDLNARPLCLGEFMHGPGLSKAGASTTRLGNSCLR